MSKKQDFKVSSAVRDDHTGAEYDYNIQREHKSRLFSFIFGREETKERTLSLYNSLDGTSYKDIKDITLTTIEDVIYMGMKNDLSYIVMDQVSLFSTMNVNEHQSTRNPNIPLREFMYVARLYDKFLKMNKKNPYSSAIIPLPIPKLVVLYNGKIEAPDETFLHLSDAFRAEIRGNLFIKNDNVSRLSEEEIQKEIEKNLQRAAPDVEVRVRMININYGHSEKILSACEPLKEYAWLIDQVRKNLAEGMEIGKAANKSLNDMPDTYEIKEQLMIHRAEVIGMWINEYNEEETMMMFREEGKQEGIQEGENLLATLINQLIALGRNDDIPKATNDQAFRDSLYVQFGLKKT